jgi:Kef-type K+ transport system membrane component KefB
VCRPLLPIQDPVLQFTVLVLAALLAQLTVERAHLPGLIGLLLLGVLLGPGTFHVLPREPLVDFLGHIGLVYVMFLAGLEIDLRVAREHATEAIAFGGLAFTCSFFPGLAAGLLFGFPALSAVLIGSLVSSHTLLAFPVVQRLGLLRRTAVVTAIGGTLLTDTLALVLLAVVLSLSAADASIWSAVRPLLLLLALSLAALRLVPRVSRTFFARTDVSQAEKALFALVALMVLSSVAEIIGTDEVLGAFLAGIVLNRSLSERAELRAHIEFVGRMLFMPFFFVYTGMLLEPAVAADSTVLLLAAALTFAVIIGKAAASWITGAYFRYATRDRALMVGLTIPQAAATLAITITAHEAGLLPLEVVDAVVLVIFFTCLAGPLLARHVGSRLARDGDGRAAPATRHGEPLEREV